MGEAGQEGVEIGGTGSDEMEVVRQARMTMNPRRRLPIGPK